MKVLNTCKCGKKFWVKSTEILRGWGKYCSNACKYKYVVRKSGLKYVLHKENPTSFKKGQEPWCKGMKGIHLNPEHEWKKGDTVDNKNFNWKGDDVGYFGIHTWIARKLGNPSECSKCGKVSSGHGMHWANKDHKYRRNIEDWIRLCAKCHREYDTKLRKLHSLS